MKREERVAASGSAKHGLHRGWKGDVRFATEIECGRHACGPVIELGGECQVVELHGRVAADVHSADHVVRIAHVIERKGSGTARGCDLYFKAYGVRASQTAAGKRDRPIGLETDGEVALEGLVEQRAWVHQHGTKSE